MITEIKRDLAADLALCEAVPEVYYDEGGGYTSPTLSEEATQFFEQASEGWPHAIRRAIVAEAEVERLRSVLSYLLGAIDRGDLIRAKMSSRMDYVIRSAREVLAE